MEYDNLLDQYAALLRRAWLNPSYKPWQRDVFEFEREHHDELDERLGRWQDISRQEQLENYRENEKDFKSIFNS